jgi:hypothetical protein
MTEPASYSNLAVKTSTGDRIKSYRRLMQATLGRDLTFTEVLDMLLDSYAQMHEEMKAS